MVESLKRKQKKRNAFMYPTWGNLHIYSIYTAKREHGKRKYMWKRNCVFFRQFINTVSVWFELAISLTKANFCCSLESISEWPSDLLLHSRKWVRRREESGWAGTGHKLFTSPVMLCITAGGAVGRPWLIKGMPEHVCVDSDTNPVSYWAQQK